MYSVDYRNSSAGVRACHRLVHELNERGYVAYSCNKTNPDWNELPWENQTPEFIAIYPEIIYGNPLESSHVVRWVLNVPGKLGGDNCYDPREIVFAWDRKYLSEVPLLTVNIVERDLFFPNNIPGVHELCYLGKGHLRVSQESPITSQLIHITSNWPSTRIELAELLRNAKTLYTYDDCSMIVCEAIACGCKVILMPEHIEFKAYPVSVEECNERINNFIANTQPDSHLESTEGPTGPQGRVNETWSVDESKRTPPGPQGRNYNEFA
jgi:hypothetical protein